MTHANCKGTGCPLKDSCNRNKYFRNSVSAFEKYEGNSSFIPPMFYLNTEKNITECDFFIGDDGSILLKKFKDSLSQFEK